MQNLDRKKCMIITLKVIKPSLSDNSCVKDQINLVERGILKTDLETAEGLNTFIGKIVKKFDTNQYSNFDPVINNVKDPTVGVILK